MHDHLRNLCDIDGIFLRRDALALGFDDKTLARALRQKVIYRIRHGAYTLHDRWQSLDELGRHRLRAKAVLRSARTDVALSHTTAAVALGAPAWELPLDTVHVTRLDSRAGRREAGIAQHCGLVLPGDVIDLDGVPVTSPVRTALDLTTIVDVEHSLPVMDHFLGLSGGSKEALWERARRMDKAPRTLATGLVVRLADGRSESVGESRSRYIFWRGGLPMPRTQYEIVERGRVVARVDFAWPEYGVFLEFDGRVKYEGPLTGNTSVVDVVLKEKRREERICGLTGWRCIRIVWADLLRPHQTVEYIRSVLAGGPIH